MKAMTGRQPSTNATTPSSVTPGSASAFGDPSTDPGAILSDEELCAVACQLVEECDASDEWLVEQGVQDCDALAEAKVRISSGILRNLCRVVADHAVREIERRHADEMKRLRAAHAEKWNSACVSLYVSTLYSIMYRRLETVSEDLDPILDGLLERMGTFERLRADGQHRERLADVKKQRDAAIALANEVIDALRKVTP